MDRQNDVMMREVASLEQKEIKQIQRLESDLGDDYILIAYKKS